MSSETSTPETKAWSPELEEDLRRALAQFEITLEAGLLEPVVTLNALDILAAAKILKEDPALDFDYVRCLSGMDYAEHLQVVYHLYSITKRHKVTVKVSLPKDKPTVDSVSSVWEAANWHEREAADMFGIEFAGHPQLVTILLEEGFEGHPLLKSYELPPFEEWSP